jgi:hypothetical protein
VRKDFAEGQRLGLTGTPSFFINGHFLSGAVKYDTLREVVEQQLAACAASLQSQQDLPAVFSKLTGPLPYSQTFLPQLGIAKEVVHCAE